MISQKVRNNASISYFFLWWLFLLSKKNTDFSDPFIRKHARNATKIHILFLAAYLFYSYFLSRFFSYSIPILEITLDHCIDIAFFGSLTLMIIQGVHASQKKESTEISENENINPSLHGSTFYYVWASEAQRIILFLSHIPFISMIIAKRYPNIVTATGVKVSSIFWFIYILSFITAGFNSITMILLFLAILVLVFLAARFFIQDSYVVPDYLKHIPSIAKVYLGLRAIPSYIMGVIKIIFWKKDSISYFEYLENIKKQDENMTSNLQGYFTDTILPFRAFWIFIPFINIIFLPKLFMSRDSRYVLAIGQGLVITGLSICLWFFSSTMQLFLLFPIFYAIASIDSEPFVRIPWIYEIYTVINTLTFWLLKKSKQIQQAQKENTEVSFTIQR